MLTETFVKPKGCESSACVEAAIFERGEPTQPPQWAFDETTQLWHIRTGDTGPVLKFTVPEWEAFVAAAKQGQYAV